MAHAYTSEILDVQKQPVLLVSGRRKHSSKGRLKQATYPELTGLRGSFGVLGLLTAQQVPKEGIQ